MNTMIILAVSVCTTRLQRQYVFVERGTLANYRSSLILNCSLLLFLILFIQSSSNLQIFQQCYLCNVRLKDLSELIQQLFNTRFSPTGRSFSGQEASTRKGDKNTCFKSFPCSNRWRTVYSATRLLGDNSPRAGT